MSRSHPEVRLPFGPVIDCEVVCGVDGLAPGPGAPPVLAGATAEEFNFITSSVPGGIDDDRMNRRLRRLGLDDAGVAAYQRAMPEATPAWIVGQAMTDSWFKEPALRLADQWDAGGGQAWLYAFEWRAPNQYGSVHCLDVPFAFDNLDAQGVAEVAGSEPPASLASDVHDSWVRFISTGDPGWPAHHREEPSSMVWDATSRVTDEAWPLVRDTWLRSAQAGGVASSEERPSR